jgi:hypothetical protein
MPYKLGRKAVKTDSRTLRLSRYLTAELPAAPVTVDWTKGITSFGALLNDSLGDCTIAGIGHAIQIWSANLGTEANITDAEALQYYEQWDGYNPDDPSTDQGGIELDVLKDFQQQGFAGHKLIAFADPSVANTEELRQAINLFGGLYIGLNVPNFIMNDIPAVWDTTSDDGGIAGGHAVFVTGYDAETFTFISWGNLYKMTLNFWAQYVDESHALIGADWIGVEGTPQGFDLAQLESDLSQIK